jgi:hypothetical protein
VLTVLVVAFFLLFLGFSVLVGHDAQRRGMSGWMWGAVCFFSPVVFGLVYVVVRHKSGRVSYIDSPSPGQAGRLSVYSLYKWWPAQVIATIGLCVLVATFLVVTSARSTTGPGWAFTGAWIAVLVLSGYEFLSRVAYRLELQNDGLRWKTPLHSGSVSLRDIREFRPWGPNAEAISLTDGRRLLAMVQRGFSAFMVDVAEQAPDIPIRVSRFSKITDRTPGWYSGYSRYE